MKNTCFYASKNVLKYVDLFRTCYVILFKLGLLMVNDIKLNVLFYIDDRFDLIL